MSITWKYIKPLKNPNEIEIFLKENSLQLPEDVIKCMKDNNGGRPSKDIFDTEESIEHVFKALLSLNREDKENIYNIYSSEFKEIELFPFATDPAGNYICIDLKDNKIVFYNHENSRKEYICNNFHDLEDLLYEI